jgi:DNA-binding transcriptional regulator GbsR (MarR family)
MDRATGIFVDGVGTAADASGVLSRLQGRIFALLYLRAEPLSLDDVATELEQSKSNISVQIRGLADWHLVRARSVTGSRKDHYEAATDLWQVMQVIMERRFRWIFRQVLAAVDETQRALEETRERDARGRAEHTLRMARLGAIRALFQVFDAGIGAFVSGEPVLPAKMRDRVPLVPVPGSRAR